ncbi:cAMP-dependent protein kinase subunit [Phytophthora boehmeriae]|uniref:cAMP-dependent protein kinase subunit n=1 Tax=Phytophthora boehmeriae TaxID=109152 RepID=A0A8T1WL38_9STRA|nr:cAMP-dependent protein kinase subunit [Phytophthora boehmeriae]
MSQSTLHSSNLPVRHHTNAFWTDPKDHRDFVPRLAVLLLNAPFDSWRVKKNGVGLRGSDLFWNMWSNAQLTVCADGGANRLYDRGVKLEAQDLMVPDYIKGDLDSLRDDVKEFYTCKGTKVLHDPDQYTNDLDKCLQLIHQVQEEHCKASGTDERFSVMIFGAMGGRFDQEMQSVNGLFRWGARFQQMVLLSDETTVQLLMPEVRHVITPNFHFETRTCGLIPIAGACKEATTSGLKWNLTPGMETGFGGLISSSNHVDDSCEQVEVVSSHPLLWTTELKK